MDADVVKRAEQKKALENIKNGLATRVRIMANRDCCPACRAAEGAYDFDEAPELPLEGCSRWGLSLFLCPSAGHVWPVGM